MKTIKKIFSLLISAVFLYFAITVGGTYKYLKEYGYGLQELPKTLAVYYGLSDGFTVGEVPDSETSIFIGNHNYIYDEIFNKHGYYEYDRLGLVGYYKNKNTKSEFSIGSGNDWCHWFRVYRISQGYKIEDFK